MHSFSIFCAERRSQLWLDLDDDDNHPVFDDEDAFLNVTMNDDGDGNDNDDASPLFFKIFLFVVISSSFCKSGAIYI